MSAPGAPAAAALRFERIVGWPEEDLAPLLAASSAEGWRHLVRLAEEWRSGAQRFAGLGEGLWIARAPAGIVALGGIVADPWARKAEIGRLCRVYVRPEARRRGVGAALVRHLCTSAAPVFRELRLRTGDPAAAAFYEALGFVRVAHLEGATHRLVLAR